MEIDSSILGTKILAGKKTDESFRDFYLILRDSSRKLKSAYRFFDTRRKKKKKKRNVTTTAKRKCPDFYENGERV